MTSKNEAALNFLLTRRSRPAKTLSGPAPDKETLETILTAAARTPDHGKLEPWRFIVLEKTALENLSVKVAKRAKEINLENSSISKACKPFQDGPLAVAVIEVQKPSEKIPTIEQTYSAGAVCLGLLNAALALGWGANWLSGWISHDKIFVRTALGLADNERVAGFVYIGTETSKPPERPRPDLNDIVTWL